MVDISIRLHYLHHGTMLHLDRTALQLENDLGVRAGIVTGIMRTARTALELIKYIDMQPYTPICYVEHSAVIEMLTMQRVLASVPLAAFLVLFDPVVENPTHAETAANLALLDVGSGHFSGLEYPSQGTLPGSIASEFTQIAQTYVREQGELESSSYAESSATTLSARLSDSTVPGESSAFIPYTEQQPYPLG